MTGTQRGGLRAGRRADVGLALALLIGCGGSDGAVPVQSVCEPVGISPGAWAGEDAGGEDPGQAMDLEASEGAGTGGGIAVFHSHEVRLQGDGSMGVVHSGALSARLDLHVSMEGSEVMRGTPFASFRPDAHPDSFNQVEGYWSGAQPYPYVGKSSVGRGQGEGETGARAPEGVLDLQVHPPADGRSTVVAFVAPTGGRYALRDLALRRVHEAGGKVRLVTLGPQLSILATIEAGSRAWQRGPVEVLLDLEEGEGVYFVVSHVDGYAYDAAEISWSLILEPEGQALAELGAGGEPASPADVSETPQPQSALPRGDASVPEESTASAEGPTGGEVGVKLMSYNLYYANLGAAERVEGVARTIADFEPHIASLQEMWGERWQILEKVREMTGLEYALAEGGPQEQYWDGDLLYRADLWEVLEDSVELYDGSRGMTWASMRHRETGSRLLVYGIHPLCCSGEETHLRNMQMATRHMLARPRYPSAPVVFMGDFNAAEGQESVRLIQEGQVDAFGQSWSVPITFEDTFRRANGPDADGNSGFGSKIDYVYTERRDSPVFRTVSATIRRDAPGGSDHFPVMAEVVLMGQ